MEQQDDTISNKIQLDLQHGYMSGFPSPYIRQVSAQSIIYMPLLNAYHHR